MNRTPEDIVISAFQQFAGKSPDETLSDSDMTLGFNLLNDTISVWNADGLYVPYLSTVSFNFIPGIGQYVFANEQPLDFDPSYQVYVKSNPILDLYYLNFVYGTIIYPMTQIGQSQFYQQVKLTNLQTLPALYFLDREQDKSTIFVYPYPNIQYPAKAKGKLNLDYLHNYDVIRQFPAEYFKLFKYELGKELTSYYRLSTWTDYNEKELNLLRRIISSSNVWSCSTITDKVLNSKRISQRMVVNGSIII